MTMLERAIGLALAAHAGQTDKAGKPYILHPLRVMLALPDDEAMRCAGVLHDVVEDTECDLDAVKRATSHEVATLVACLTRKSGTTYRDYIGNFQHYARARLVKIADVSDNLSRVEQLKDAEEQKFFKRRYTRALDRLRAMG